MTLLCVWMYLLVTWSFGWASAGKFFLTEIVFLFHNRRSFNPSRKGQLGPCFSDTANNNSYCFLVQTFFQHERHFVQNTFFPEIFELFSKCSGNFDIDLMVVVSGP